MKIWIDACEPKTVIMLRPLYNKLKAEHDIYITSRDFDSTYYLLDKYEMPQFKAGKHGGGTKIGKLEAYSERLEKIINITKREKPEFLFCLASPEALRVSFGLGIPNIVFNDEPRSVGVVKLTLSLADQVIVPECIPVEWYLKIISEKDKLIRFNGIDEVGWLSDFQPDDSILNTFNLIKDEYIVCRTEATKAQYLADKMEPYETQLAELVPALLEKAPNIKYVILTRYQEQFEYLNKAFSNKIEDGTIKVFTAMEELAQIMYFAKLVITGGGTMVRESALLGVPSIEYFPLDTYPQEQFLIDNGFPLKHIKTSSQIIDVAVDYINGDYRIDTRGKIAKLDNPIEIALNEFQKRIEN